MNYLIAVLPDRMKAEAAYTALEEAEIPKEKIAILGRGYQTADEFGFLNPNQQAKKRAIQMAYWLIPFGFAAGYSFNQITAIELFDWAGALGNHIIGGVFGSIAAAMGSVFVGGGLGLSNESGDALPYRNRLNAGKYLVVVRYSGNLKDEVVQILDRFEPENMQAYVNT